MARHPYRGADLYASRRRPPADLPDAAPLFGPRNRASPTCRSTGSCRRGRPSSSRARSLADLIGRSAHRAIIHQCTCRLDRGCADHDTGIGCMLLGDGAAEIDGRIARHVSTREALDHLDRALEDGLMPLVGRAPIDNSYLGGAKPGAAADDLLLLPVLLHDPRGGQVPPLGRSRFHRRRRGCRSSGRIPAAAPGAGRASANASWGRSLWRMERSCATPHAARPAGGARRSVPRRRSV